MKKGFALITVLAVLIVIALGVAMVLQSTGSHTAMKSNNRQDAMSQSLALAGMQHALWKCRTSGCISEPAFSIDGTNVDITVTPVGGNTTEIVVKVDFNDVQNQ